LKEFSKEYRRLVKETTDTSIKEYGTQIIDYNTLRMENTGKKSDGTIIGGYSPTSLAMGKTDPVRLHDTGDFHSGVELKKIGQNKFKTQSTDWKNDMLIQEWGEDIFGLQENELEDVAKVVADDLVKALKQFL
jgi:hypothetical protein